MTAAGEPIAAAAVEHVAGVVARRQGRVGLVASCVTVITAAGIAAIGLAGIPVALAAFAVAGRTFGRARRARAIAKATADPAVAWFLVGGTVVGHAESGGAELALALPAAQVRALRALPAARVRAAPGGGRDPEPEAAR